MRNRRKTIESLKRLAERPGTPSEGRVARAMLERMTAKGAPIPKPFNLAEFSRGTSVFYNYWAYPENDPCVIVGRKPKIVDGETWLRMRFDRLKQPRYVPVTSAKGSHISKAPLSAADAEYLYNFVSRMKTSNPSRHQRDSRRKQNDRK
jgi:hypothetical protein